MNDVMSPDDLEAALRRIGAERYHNHHPFHKALHAGRLTQGQVQAWALNRFYYQSRIPMKDASLMARLSDPALRRVWRQRLVDHDGDAENPGGIARWLRLAEGVGLDPGKVAAEEGILPATRFAVDAYIAFVSQRSELEAVASSLTELFSPGIIAERVKGMLGSYDFVDAAALDYFTYRLDQAPRDADFALDYVKREARTMAQQAAALNALRFKCDVLWALLDALQHAYVVPGEPPPGAFRP